MALLLSSGSQPDSKMVAAQKMLGIRTASFKDFAVISSNNGSPHGGLRNGLVYFDKTPPNIIQMFSLLDEFTLLFRAVPKNPGPFRKMLVSSQDAAPAISPYARFLANVDEWVLPGGSVPFGRELLMWADIHTLMRFKSSGHRFMDGHLVRQNELGLILRAALNRTALQDSLRTSGKTAPEKLAAPVEIRWRADDVIIGAKSYAYWLGYLETNETGNEKQVKDLLSQVSQLLKMRFDVLLHCEKIGRKVYGRLQLRAAAPVSSSFTRFQDRLELIGKGGWQQLTGFRVREAHEAFTPGTTKKPLDEKVFQILKPTEVFAGFQAVVSPKASHFGGDTALGKVSLLRDPFFVQSSTLPSVIIEGQSGTGKSTLAAYYALQQGPEVVFIQLTPADKEGAQNWAAKFGGQVMPIDLLDAKDQPAETELLQRDSEDAVKAAREIFVALRKGEAGQLPLLIYPVKKSLRFYNWVLAFYEVFTQEWAKWSEDSGRHATVIFDDMVSWPSTPDSFLEDMGVTLGHKARHAMRTAVDTVRKDRQRVIFTVHSVEELAKDYPAGFLESSTQLVRLGNDGHQMAQVIDPKRNELLAEINVHLPVVLVDDLGRTDGQAP